MSATKITVATTVHAPLAKAWEAYTAPEHIINWNFAVPEWHCPSASNDLREGGTYKARMEARDGNFGFDFEAVYEKVDPMRSFTYVLGDGRRCEVRFEPDGDTTKITVTFDAESQNPVEMQRGGWQAILDNYGKYAGGL